MNRTISGLVAVVAALAVSQAERAVAEEGYYFEFHGGGTFLQDSDIHVDGGGRSEVEFDGGYMFGGAFGYAWEEGFRGEVAVDFRHNDIDDSSVNGDMTSLSGMVNGYFQLPVDFPVKPYVGGGIGLASINMDAKTSGMKFVDSDDRVFAYQGMAGVTVEINPIVALGAGYVYFATLDPDLETEGGTSFDAEYASHNFLIQLRISTHPTGAM